jgi:hypothetical protein
MTQSQLRQHYYTRYNNPGNYIKRHKRPSGDLCYRVMDAAHNPLDNIAPPIMNWYLDEGIVIPGGDGRWVFSKIKVKW